MTWTDDAHSTDRVYTADAINTEVNADISSLPDGKEEVVCADFEDGQDKGAGQATQPARIERSKMTTE